MTSGNRSTLVLHLMIKWATLETFREPAFFRILMLRYTVVNWSLRSQFQNRNLHNETVQTYLDGSVILSLKIDWMSYLCYISDAFIIAIFLTILGTMKNTFWTGASNQNISKKKSLPYFVLKQGPQLPLLESFWFVV